METYFACKLSNHPPGKEKWKHQGGYKNIFSSWWSLVSVDFCMWQLWQSDQGYNKSESLEPYNLYLASLFGIN